MQKACHSFTRAPSRHSPPLLWTAASPFFASLPDHIHRSDSCECPSPFLAHPFRSARRYLLLSQPPLPHRLPSGGPRLFVFLSSHILPVSTARPHLFFRCLPSTPSHSPSPPFGKHALLLERCRARFVSLRSCKAWQLAPRLLVLSFFVLSPPTHKALVTTMTLHVPPRVSGHASRSLLVVRSLFPTQPSTSSSCCQPDEESPLPVVPNRADARLHVHASLC